jgi:hypothetical protein
MNREAAMKKYNLLKSKRHLAEYMDYDPSFLRRLSDKDLSYLIDFLEKMYYHDYPKEVDMHVQCEDTVSANEIDERTMDYADTAYIIKIVRPSA